jgi:hypothetical protein
VSPRASDGFEWRAGLGAWRWLILGTLGVAPYACSGKTAEQGQSGDSRDLSAGGMPGPGAMTGAGGAAMTFGGAAGSVMVSAGGESAAGAAGSGSMQTASTPSPCVFDAALGGGVERCKNGLLHRVAPGSCPSLLPLPDPVWKDYPTLRDWDAGGYACLFDADCTEKPYGHCELAIPGGPNCTYGCAVDADCAPDQVCYCESYGGRCILAKCHGDAECGSGRLCAVDPTCNRVDFICQTAEDECSVASDCPSGTLCDLESVDFNNPAAGARRACIVVGCPVPGRPFLVDGTERCAPLEARADWYSDGDYTEGGAAAATDLPCSPQLRAAIARCWTEQALQEHASVAAFARFVLQLLGLGAPAELIADATSAMQDEVRHAQDCFRLARRYAAHDAGPGPLPLEGAFASTELCEVIVGTVLEGCIGETVAAIEAAEALQHCADPAARSVLARIAADETRHAELAWRCVAWALERAAGTPEFERLRQQVQSAFAGALGGTVTSADRAGSADRELARHGLLSPVLRRELRQRVLFEVVAPCARALLEPPSGRADVARDAEQLAAG